MTWDIKAGLMGKGLCATMEGTDESVQRAAAEYLYSHFPGLEDKLSIDDYLAERASEQDRLFRQVPPMRGAVELVQGLVSQQRYPGY